MSADKDTDGLTTTVLPADDAAREEQTPLSTTLLDTDSGSSQDGEYGDPVAALAALQNLMRLQAHFKGDTGLAMVLAVKAAHEAGEGQGSYPLTAFVARSLNMFFRASTDAVLRRKRVVFAVTAILTIGFALSFILLLEEESDGQELWVPIDMDGYKDEKRFKETFPPGPRVSTAIFSKDGGDILSKSFLLSLLDLEERILSDTAYFDDCFRYAPERDCLLPLTVLSAWAFSRDRIMADENPHQTLEDYYFRQAGETYQTALDIDWSPEDEFGQMHVRGLRACKIAYFYRSDCCLTKMEATDDVFVDLIRDHWPQLQPTVNGVPYVESSLSKEVARVIAQDVPLVAISIFLVLVFCAVFLGDRTLVGSRLLLGAAGITGMLIAFVIGIGSLPFVGEKQTPITPLVLFVLIGIGVDDIIIIVDSVNHNAFVSDIRRRLIKAVAVSGPAITLTTLTDITAFAFGSMATMPAVRSFTVSALITLLADFVLQCTLFLIFVEYDERRIEALRLDCCPCIIVDNPDATCVECVRSACGSAPAEDQQEQQGLRQAAGSPISPLAPPSQRMGNEGKPAPSAVPQVAVAPAPPEPHLVLTPVQDDLVGVSSSSNGPLVFPLDTAGGTSSSGKTTEKGVDASMSDSRNRPTSPTTGFLGAELTPADSKFCAAATPQAMSLGAPPGGGGAAPRTRGISFRFGATGGAITLGGHGETTNSGHGAAGGGLAAPAAAKRRKSAVTGRAMNADVLRKCIVPTEGPVGTPTLQAMESSGQGRPPAFTLDTGKGGGPGGGRRQSRSAAKDGVTPGHPGAQRRASVPQPAAGPAPGGPVKGRGDRRLSVNAAAAMSMAQMRQRKSDPKVTESSQAGLAQPRRMSNSEVGDTFSAVQPFNTSVNTAAAADEEVSCAEKVMKMVWTPVVTHRVGKFIILLVFFGWIGVCAAVAPSVKQGQELTATLATDSYVRDYFDASDQHYGGVPATVYVVIDDPRVVWNSQETVHAFDDLRVNMEAVDSVQRFNTWVHGFVTWAGRQKRNEAEYNSSVRLLMESPLGENMWRLLPIFWDKYPESKTAVVLETPDDPRTIKASYFAGRQTVADGTWEKADDMADVRGVVQRWHAATGVRSYATAGFYGFADGDRTIHIAIRLNLVLSGVAVMATLLLFVSPYIAVLIVLNVGMIDMSIFGWMYFLGIAQSPVTFIVIAMSIGLSVDYCAHVGISFANCRVNKRSVSRISLGGVKADGTADYYVRMALDEIGVSVFAGGMTTLLGILALAGASSETFLTFFLMLFAAVIFGMLHGFIFFPALLACLPQWLVERTVVPPF
eukprot:TRINITY_DN22270_c0_g2_i1.p1 TRINITY_DN22270_c0_g2~~TRINITY_DN22270_c0_g2_i1.p1  ORF type:complete len:1366 (+),score=383.24 TRINITY_DN22270_c0_g2_i1:171-4100(+)